MRNPSSVRTTSLAHTSQFSRIPDLRYRHSTFISGLMKSADIFLVDGRLTAAASSVAAVAVAVAAALVPASPSHVSPPVNDAAVCFGE